MVPVGTCAQRPKTHNPTAIANTSERFLASMDHPQRRVHLYLSVGRSSRYIRGSDQSQRGGRDDCRQHVSYPVSPEGGPWRGGSEPGDTAPGNGADDETVGRDFESDGEKAELNRGSRDRRNERAQHALDAAALLGARLQRPVRPTAG